MSTAFVHPPGVAHVGQEQHVEQRTGTHTLRADALRAQIESSLGDRFAGALSPTPRQVRETLPTDLDAFDAMLGGGLPLGAITEFAGPLCSGRTGAALHTVAAAMRRGSMCAWVDASDAFDPQSAAANGVCLDRLLWVRCGVQAMTQVQARTGQSTTRPGESSVQPRARAGQHPREEVRGLDTAVGELLRESGGRRDKSIGTPGAPNRVLSGPAADCPAQTKFLVGYGPGVSGQIAGRSDTQVNAARPFRSVAREEQVSSDRQPKRGREGAAFASPGLKPAGEGSRPYKEIPSLQTHAGSFVAGKPWGRLDQALRAADLLLQAGGFRVLVLDLGSIAPEHALRIPLATWFRFRAAADANQTVLLAITQISCARSSAGLVVRFGALEAQSVAMPLIAEASLPGDCELHSIDNKAIENESAQQTLAPGNSGKAMLIESIRYHARPLRQRFTPSPQQLVAIDHPASRRPPQATWQLSAYPSRETA